MFYIMFSYSVVPNTKLLKRVYAKCVVQTAVCISNFRGEAKQYKQMFIRNMFYFNLKDRSLIILLLNFLQLCIIYL